MNETALNQLPVIMHDLEEEGNANGFVCLFIRQSCIWQIIGSQTDFLLRGHFLNKLMVNLYGFYYKRTCFVEEMLQIYDVYSRDCKLVWILSIPDGQFQSFSWI